MLRRTFLYLACRLGKCFTFTVVSKAKLSVWRRILYLKCRDELSTIQPSGSIHLVAAEICCTLKCGLGPQQVIEETNPQSITQCEMASDYPLTLKHSNGKLPIKFPDVPTNLLFLNGVFILAMFDTRGYPSRIGAPTR